MTPDTTNYLILGYFVFFTVMVIYLFSLYWRSRSLKQDVELLEELERQGKNN
ncbi:MAG TPA: hypothetical protein VJL34_10520 [Anaerolineales bacterium]|nr:hypothetical protein [Anaerolineales bacterium]